MLKKSIYLIVFVVLISCGPKPETSIPFISGYWEISSVKKGNTVINEYSMSPIIDYWQVNDDLSGFRKKVMPNLEGKLIVTQHSVSFDLKIEDNELIVLYHDNGVTYSETIIKATFDEMVITNDQGLQYYYKPYKSLISEDE